MKMFQESEPIILPKSVFRSYSFCQLTQDAENENSGLFIEDNLFEITFIKETNVKLKIPSEAPMPLPFSFIMGKPPIPYQFMFDPSLTLFTIKLQPWVSSFFYKKEEFAVVDLAKEYKGIALLHDQIFGADDFQEMINHVESFFVGMAMPSMDDHQITKEICKMIYQHNGVIKIKALLSHFPYSRQKINRLFLTQTKSSIKEFAIFIRIRAVIRYKINNPEESLTAIAYEFGYFDQSHFIKDMKRVTGVSPSEFLSKENLFSEQLKSK